MIRELKISNIEWIDGVGNKKNEIENILSNYNFHELKLEFCVEGN